MREFLRKYRGVAIIVGLLLIPLIFLYASARGREPSGRLARAVQWVTGPVQSGLVRATHGVTGVVGHYVWLVGVRDDNERLEEEIRRLRWELREREEQARENERLRRLLRFAERTPEARYVAARVIAFGVSSSFRTLRIDRGTRDGVERRAGVITAGGVVGRVITASRFYADVLLITDAGSRLDVMSARERTFGVLSGGGVDRLCTIQAMDRTLELATGDRLVTSGLDGVFPKGVPVGVVREVNRPTMGLYLDATVEPYVPFSKLEEVLVMVSPRDTLHWPEIPSDAGTVVVEDGGVPDAAVEAGTLAPAARPPRGRPAPRNQPNTPPGDGSSADAHPTPAHPAAASGAADAAPSGVAPAALPAARPPAAPRRDAGVGEPTP